jgi:hypothetical protein
VLNTIKEQLKKQEEEKKYSQEKVTEFIHTHDGNRNGKQKRPSLP